ncbi:MAG TPA: DinB family protein, partial [Ignavibacteriaceae bacterium]|nr:DinB family protein [Ignavibacteriaceae bacterium]
MADFNLREILLNALAGVNAHIKPINVLEDLNIEIVGKEIKNSPYTIWQILKHINYWQEKFISYVKDETTPPALTAKEGWAFSKSPLTEEELKAEIKKFSDSMNKANNLTEEELNKKAQRYKSGYNVLQSMASHISYHIGEIVLLRRIIGNWP